MEEFWTSNPSILYRKYNKIIPENSDNMIETLNTLTRLCIYLFMITYIFGIGVNVSIVSLMMIVLIIIYHELYIKNNNLIAKDLVKDEKDREKFTETKKYNFNTKPINLIYNDNKENNKEDIEIQSGYIDFDNEYRIGNNKSEIDIDDYLRIEEDKKNEKLPYNKYRYVIDRIERKPEINNPFRNITFNDYMIKDSSLPENMDKIERDIYDFKREKELNKEGEKIYNSSIYRNVEDVFSRENSQRIFMTQPIKQLANSQKDFAEWLYKRDETCKENTEKCTYYEIPNMQSPRY